MNCRVGHEISERIRFYYHSQVGLTVAGGPFLGKVPESLLHC